MYLDAAAFYIGIFPLAVFVAAGSLVIVATGAMRKWLGYVGLADGIARFAAPLGGARGPLREPARGLLLPHARRRRGLDRRDRRLDGTTTRGARPGPRRRADLDGCSRDARATRGQGYAVDELVEMTRTSLTATDRGRYARPRPARGLRGRRGLSRVGICVSACQQTSSRRVPPGPEEWRRTVWNRHSVAPRHPVCPVRNRLDKLGVTGSSPVPPTSEIPANAGLSSS